MQNSLITRLLVGSSATCGLVGAVRKVETLCVPSGKCSHAASTPTLFPTSLS